LSRKFQWFSIPMTSEAFGKAILVTILPSANRLAVAAAMF
jgi:hypothetical protein